MPLKAAFLFIAPDCDPAQHRAVIDSPAVQLSVVGVKNYADAQQAAARSGKPWRTLDSSRPLAG